MYFAFFFPVGTDSRSKRPPVGTITLLGLAFAVFALRFFDPPLHAALVQESFRPSRPEVLRALLSLFLHGGWVHLLGNSLYLWIFGRQLEGRHGPVSLAAIFALGGVAACWAQAWLTPADSPWFHAPLIGASGGVAALLGATLTRFPHQRVRVFYCVLGLIGAMNRAGFVHLNTVVACVAWFGLEVVHGLVAWGNGGGAVAYAAHGGGFLSGIALAVAGGFHRRVKQEVHREKGRRYFEKGDWYAAAGELTTHLQAFPDDFEVRAMRARAFIVLGRTGEASTEYQRVFRDARRRRDVDVTTRLYREMRRYGLGSNLSESGLLRIAFDFQKAGKSEEAAEAFLELATLYPAGPKSELALVRRAEILWSHLGDYREARSTYRRLLETWPDGEWNELARARLRSMEVLTGATSPGSPSARAIPSARPASSS